MRILLVLLVACGGSEKPVAPPRVAKAPPPPPTCEAVGNHVQDLVEPKDDHARRIGSIFTQRCTTDAWSPEIRTCILGTMSLDERRGCKAKLAQAQREALDHDLAEAERAHTTHLPSSCEAYKDIIEKLAACDKIPQQSRDALKQGFEAMESGWANIESMPPEAQQAMQDACKQGVDALVQVAKDLCGW